MATVDDSSGEATGGEPEQEQGDGGVSNTSPDLNSPEVQQALDRMDPFCRQVLEAYQQNRLQELMQSMDMNEAVTKLMGCMQEVQNLQDSLDNNDE